MVGFHNIDLGQNIRYVNAEYSLNLVDYTAIGKSFDGLSLYILGVNQILIGFVMQSCLIITMFVVNR